MRRLVADRVKKGFNVIQFAVANPCDQFWGAVLNGAPGHCYGTDSLWQTNSRQQPFGESASGFTWGNWPWEEAMHWPGSTCVSVGKRILEKFEWRRLEPHPEWLSATEEKDGRALIAAAAGSCAVPRGPINHDWVLVLINHL